MRRRALDDKQEHAVDVIERSARRLLRLGNDLLVLAQIRAGRLTLGSQPVDVSRIAAQATALLRPLADHARVRIAARCPARKTIVDGDPHRLSQLLDNLIANAIRFTPAGGTVTVRVRDHRGSVRLEIDDTGAGIPDVDRERLFEAFTRGATTDAPGTGLGLSIVKPSPTRRRNRGHTEPAGPRHPFHGHLRSMRRPVVHDMIGRRCRHPTWTAGPRRWRRGR